MNFHNLISIHFLPPRRFAEDGKLLLEGVGMTELSSASGLQDVQQCQTAGQAMVCLSIAYIAELGINVKNYFTSNARMKRR